MYRRGYIYHRMVLKILNIFYLFTIITPNDIVNIKDEENNIEDYDVIEINMRFKYISNV